MRYWWRGWSAPYLASVPDICLLEPSAGTQAMLALLSATPAYAVLISDGHPTSQEPASVAGLTLFTCHRYCQLLPVITF